MRFALENQSAEVAASAKDSSSSASNERLFQLGRYKAELPAAPANVGVFPVPVEPGIDLTIVASDSTKTQEHPTNARDTEKQQNHDRVSQCDSGLRTIENTDETDEAPKEGKTYWYSPKQKRATVPARIWRCSGEGRIGLASTRMERARICAGPLLVEDRSSHDVRGSALVALIRIELRYGCHSAVPDLATPCDTGLLE
jgi:hypothetical protein